MDFVAIDFETANQQRNSPCAIGLVVVENGVIVKRVASLIRPPTRYFSPFNIGIHGITWEDVKDKPEFGDLFPEIRKIVGEKILVAHNASFDVGVLRATLDHYGIPHPTVSYACTVAIARSLWPGLLNHKLDTVASFLGLEFQHHDASEDAWACSNICIRAGKETGSPSVPDLMRKLRLCMKWLPQEARPVKKSGHQERQETGPLQGRNFVFTGALESMTRAEAEARVCAAGGRCAGAVSSNTHFLVVGEQHVRRLREGSGSRKLREAEELASHGAPIRILSEREFLDMTTPVPGS